MRNGELVSVAIKTVLVTGLLLCRDESRVLGWRKASENGRSVGRSFRSSEPHDAHAYHVSYVASMSVSAWAVVGECDAERRRSI